MLVLPLCFSYFRAWLFVVVCPVVGCFTFLGPLIFFIFDFWPDASRRLLVFELPIRPLAALLVGCLSYFGPLVVAGRVAVAQLGWPPYGPLHFLMSFIFDFWPDASRRLLVLTSQVGFGRHFSS